MRAPPFTALLLLLAVALLSCAGDKFDEPMRLGGQTVSAETLNQGHGLYQQYCRSCHGEDGDAREPGTSGLLPPPRDFSAGWFKFTSVAGDDLPTDADLLRIVRYGLVGTPMLPFGNLTDREVLAVVQYVKTFSERWQSEVQGISLPVASDPWGIDERDRAVARGADIFHGAGGCVRCHPAYRPASAIEPWRSETVSVAGRTLQTPDFREDLSQPAEVDTVYGRVLSHDFLNDRPRAGSRARDLYRVVAAGVGGTPMRGLHGRLPTRDLWAVVHYLDSLLVLRGTDHAEALRERLAEGASESEDGERVLEP